MLKIPLQKVVPLIVLLTILSCTGSKVAKTLRQGQTLQKDFKTTFPFEYRNGLIIVKVKIRTESYNFILDTGASNVLSQELATKLNLNPLGSESIGDIYDDSQTLQYAKLDNINVGGIDFQETIAAIVEINKVTELACLEVDGLLGANLMRHAVWDIDFKNQTITLTDNERSLDIPDAYSESKLFIGSAGVPSIITKVNGERVLNNLIDLGNNGNVTLDFRIFQRLRKKNKISKYIKPALCIRIS